MLSRILSLLFVVMLATACSSNSKNGAASDINGGMGAAGGVSALQQELQTSIGDRVFFDYDSSVINAEGQATLQRQAEWLQRNPGVTVTVEGHCDERGTREYNLALGERRAAAVRNYLISLNVPSERISTISYGKERPEQTGSDEESWRANRRGTTVVN